MSATLTEQNFDIVTRPLEESEKKFYGIFISHSNNERDNKEFLQPLLEALRAKKLYPLCDRDILAGGDDFQSRIESYLNCYAGLIIVTEHSLRSDWVNYEIGVFAGQNTPVFLWDPTGLLDNKYVVPGVASIHGSHLSKYIPALHTLDEVVELLGEVSPYADMCLEETALVTKQSFLDRVMERVETVIVKVESDIFEEHYEDFALCKLGVLVTNFGMFYEGHADGEHCQAKFNKSLENGCCPVSGRDCALCSRQRLNEDNKECVLLNYVLPNGAFVRKGEVDRNGERYDCAAMVFHMPLHTLFGTEFKFIMEVPNNPLYQKLTDILEQAGMNPSASSSFNGGRIYLSIPSRKNQGFFRLHNEFENNFLCPMAGRKKSIGF